MLVVQLSTLPSHFLEAGVKICGAWQANAVAVAEYVVSQMILGIKRRVFYPE